MQIVSNFYFVEKKTTKNIISLSAAEFADRVIKVIRKGTLDAMYSLKYTILEMHLGTNFNTRNSWNGCVTTAGGIQEKELNAQTKHSSVKHEK